MTALLIGSTIVGICAAYGLGRFYRAAELDCLLAENERLKRGKEFHREQRDRAIRAWTQHLTRERVNG